METIKDLPLMQRPREKLLHFGPSALSNAELMAILLGSGNSKMSVVQICNELVAAIDDQPDKLTAMTIGKLCAIKGIGEIKAIVLTAALELGKRALSVTQSPLLLNDEAAVLQLLKPYFANQESAGYFLVMINNRQELLATTEYVIDKKKLPEVKHLIKKALETGASEIVLCRPGCKLPSKYLNEEKALVIQLDAAASMMNIRWRGLLIP